MEVAESIPSQPMGDLDDILSTADNLAEALDINPCKSNSALGTVSKHPANGDGYSCDEEIKQNGDVVLVSEDEEDHHHFQSDEFNKPVDKKTDAASPARRETEVVGQGSDENTKQVSNGQSELEVKNESPEPHSIILNGEGEEHVVDEDEATSPQSLQIGNPAEKPETPIEILDSDDDLSKHSDIAHTEINDPPSEAEPAAASLDPPAEDKSKEQLAKKTNEPQEIVEITQVSANGGKDSREACSETETTKEPLATIEQNVLDVTAGEDDQRESEKHDTDSDVEMIEPLPAEDRKIVDEMPDDEAKQQKQTEIEDADSDIEMIDLDAEIDEKTTPADKETPVNDLEVAEQAIVLDTADPDTSIQKQNDEILTIDDHEEEDNCIATSSKEEPSPKAESEENCTPKAEGNENISSRAEHLDEVPPKVENDVDSKSAEQIAKSPSKEPSASNAQDEDAVDRNASKVPIEVEPEAAPSEMATVSPAPMQNDEVVREIDKIQPVSPSIIELSDDDSEDGDSTSQPKCDSASSAVKEEKINDACQSVPSVPTTSAAQSVPKIEKIESTTQERIQSVSSSDDEENIYYEKECINYECLRDSKKFYKTPLFILNFYKIQKKTNKTQFVCNSCFDNAVKKLGVLAAALKGHESLLEQEIPKRQDFVEILDSSDEDEGEEAEKAKDEQELDPESIDLLSKELDATIEEILDRVDARQQVTWAKSIMSEKLSKMEVECQEITESLKQLQNSADKMHTALYQCPKIKIKELPPLDLNTGRPYTSETESMLPPLGELKYPPIEVNSIYYAVRNKAIASWLPCRVIDSMDVVISGQKSVKYYKVKYLRIKIPTVKCVSAKHMAYGDAPSVRLSIGTRVIALFDGSTLSKNNKESIAPSAFYPGVVAEQLQAYNKYRYLIFFDDGYAQYVHQKDVRIVCQVAENVWEDVHPASREFIHNYLSQYQKHRPMVQVKKGQSMITESNGKWLYAKVIDVDASLVQMQFDGQNRYEWIYRGSTRLGPLFKEKQSNGTASAPASIPRRSEPYVRYDEDTTRNDNTQSQEQEQNHAEKQQAARSVAKKSTARQDSQQSSSSQPVVKHLNNSTIFLEDDNRPKGKVVYYTAKKNLPPKTFIPHDCKPGCLFSITHNLHSYSPLAKPLLSGWERQIFKSKLKKSVVYRAPCGRRIRNMEELHRYLRLTKNVLNVDNFDFDCAIHCLAEYVIDSSIVSKADLSNGIENMVIPCINYYDNTMPPHCEYSVERIPTEGVNMNLDPNFLVGCDCEDDCLDKSKCSCWQLTMSGGRFGNPNTPPENVGYWFKRLLEPVPTGVYECNKNCKCSKNCINRVVQNPLQVKLQVFKTSNRGWGLRCLNDISKGTFICIYAGHLLTEQKANEGGVNASDEYFAELDYIEVVERLKEGYESDVQDDNESEDEDIEEPNPDADSDEDFHSKCNVNNKDASINTRLRTRRGTSDDDKTSKKARVERVEDSQERRVISFEPNISLGNEENASANTKYRSIRKYFGKNEFCYIMDAKKTGNIGRYFNHSCSPNLFVQNVFVDTQDLRFPWVAFFALTHIRAGTELTWNYNYEVGIVPGKVLYCECGAPNCRGRLL